MKKYVIEFFIHDFKASRFYTTEPITKKEVKKMLNELSPKWEIKHIYEVNKELTIDELKKEGK